MRSEPLATGLQGVWLEWQPGEWEHFDASNTGGVIPTQMNLMKTYLDAAGNVYLWGTADERSGPHIAQNVLRTGRRATNTWFSYAVTPETFNKST